MASEESLNISEINFSMFEEPLITPSAPMKKTRCSSPFLQSIPHPKSKVACPECGRKYINLGFYRQHVRKHAIEKSSARYPDKQAVLDHLSSIVQDVLADIQQTILFFVEEGVTLKKLVDVILVCTSSADWIYFTEVICDIYLKSVLCKKFLLPSSLLDTLLKTTDEFLSSIEQRNAVIPHLENFRSEQITTEMLQRFVSIFTVKFMHHLLRFISRSVRNVTPVQGRRRVNFDEDDKQVIRYIGGSVMKGFMRTGKRYPKNQIWARIVKTINSKVLDGEKVQPAPSQVKEWTEAQNRGSLLVIGLKCQNFVLSLAEVCGYVEKHDGSLPYEEVLKEVHRSGTSVLWDEMIEDALPENESLKFLNAVVRSFCQTYGKGTAKRHINAVGGKGTASVPLRHRVAPR